MFEIPAFRALALAGLAAVSLSGCVSAPKQQAFNRDATPVDEVVVLTMRASEVDLMILNNPGYSFGLIGASIAEANRIPKRNKLREHIAAAGFDHVAVFRERLEHALVQRGYTVRWSEPAIEGEDGPKAKRNMWGLRKTYAAAEGIDADAMLDVNFGFVGYAAAGSSDAAPYRPTGVVSARLVDADGKTTLFSDFIVYNNVFNNMQAITIAPDAAYVYPDFDDLDAAGPKAVAGLESAIESLADELAKQL